MDELKRRQARLLRGGMDIRRGSEVATGKEFAGDATVQAEQLRRALRAAFNW